jgi:predicted nucleic acid-binding protein
MLCLDSSGVIRSASRPSPSGLRTLDAIHLATALSLQGDIGCLITYDVRLAEAATMAGLEVRSPGLDPM